MISQLNNLFSKIKYYFHSLHNFAPASSAITKLTRVADSKRENRFGYTSVLPSVTLPILAVYNEFPLDCIAITGKQIAPSISQIAGSENEISQSGLPMRATFVPIARTRRNVCIRRTCARFRRLYIHARSVNARRTQLN